MINLEKLHSKYDFIIGFKAKHITKFMSDQDKKHIRILATMQLIRDKQIEHILNAEFSEKFIFDEENQSAYYCIKFIRKEDQKYADC